MSNAQHSKKHGLKLISILRPKSKLRVRKNKIKASLRKAERRALKNA